MRRCELASWASAKLPLSLRHFSPRRPPPPVNDGAPGCRVMGARPTWQAQNCRSLPHRASPGGVAISPQRANFQWTLDPGEGITRPRGQDRAIGPFYYSGLLLPVRCKPARRQPGAPHTAEGADHGLVRSGLASTGTCIRVVILGSNCATWVSSCFLYYLCYRSVRPGYARRGGTLAATLHGSSNLA